jgi:hypothetical protein
MRVVYGQNLQPKLRVGSQPSLPSPRSPLSGAGGASSPGASTTEFTKEAAGKPSPSPPLPVVPRRGHRNDGKVVGGLSRRRRGLHPGPCTHRGSHPQSLYTRAPGQRLRGAGPTGGVGGAGGGRPCLLLSGPFLAARHNVPRSSYATGSGGLVPSLPAGPALHRRGRCQRLTPGPSPTASVGNICQHGVMGRRAAGAHTGPWGDGRLPLVQW